MALTEDKLIKKKQALITRTAQALSIEPDDASVLLSIGRTQSVRINTLQASAEKVLVELRSRAVGLSPVPWMNNGYFLTENATAARDSDLNTSGAIYIQNAASWLPVLALDPKPGHTILDMCAAPGGKTSHIAQITKNNAIIYANDNSRPRLHRLQANLERLGVKGVTYTLHDATRLSKHLEIESFDRILLDAPCSGEGMMALDDKKSFESWSVAHIKRLQTLQKKLIVQAWHLLKPGGTLVYSTCTMAPEENEAVIDYLLRHNNNCTVQSLESFKQALDGTVPSVQEWNGKRFDSRVEDTLRLKPTVCVEAFFVAKITKGASASIL